MVLPDAGVVQKPSHGLRVGLYTQVEEACGQDGLTCCLLQVSPSWAWVPAGGKDVFT